jgi:hypothetical protein
MHPRGRYKGGLLMVAACTVVLAVAACADDSSGGNPLNATSTSAGSAVTAPTAPSSTDSGASSTTSEETSSTSSPPTTSEEPTTTTTEPLSLAAATEAMSLSSSPAPPPPADLLAGSPDVTASAELTAALETLGVDLTGVTVSVWPVWGTGDVLLVITVDDRAAALESDTAVGDLVIPTLLASPTLDTAGVNRLVFCYEGSDDSGPYLFTITYPLDAVRAALANGTGLPDDQSNYGVRRP